MGWESWTSNEWINSCELLWWQKGDCQAWVFQRWFTYFWFNVSLKNGTRFWERKKTNWVLKRLKVLNVYERIKKAIKIVYCLLGAVHERRHIKFMTFESMALVGLGRIIQRMLFFVRFPTQTHPQQPLSNENKALQLFSSQNQFSSLSLSWLVFVSLHSLNYSNTKKR